MKNKKLLLLVISALLCGCGGQNGGNSEGESTSKNEDSVAHSEVESGASENESVNSENQSESDFSASEEESESESISSSEEESNSTSDSPTVFENVLKVEEALAIVRALPQGDATTEKYYVKGTINDIYNTTYGNCHLIDGENDLLIYGAYSFDGSTRYDAMTNKFKEGDEVIFYGNLMHFYSTSSKYEMVNGWVMSINGVDQSKIDVDNPPQTSDSSSESQDPNVSFPVSADGWTNSDYGTYYSSIDFTDDASGLLSSLRALDSAKHKTTITYKNLWNYYNKTDYDPNNRSNYLAFYRGISATKGEMNKEHVWPNSRGGNLVENDLHMVRPTLTSDNSDRGNSFYVEGMKSTTSGWDPLAAGMVEQYRGQAARIIFYCVIANSQLSLVDKEIDASSNKTMGKLSDLLRWNLENEVVQSELNRNNGAQSVQGNRNPFIDNPGLACAIWGNTNSTTRSICSN